MTLGDVRFTFFFLFTEDVISRRVFIGLLAFMHCLLRNISRASSCVLFIGV